MAALAFTLAMTWTCLTIHEKSTLNSKCQKNVPQGRFWQSMKEFFALSPEVSKICIMQFYVDRYDVYDDILYEFRYSYGLWCS